MIRFSPDLHGGEGGTTGEFVSCQSKIPAMWPLPLRRGERPRPCSPRPVRLQQRGVVHNSWEQCGEGPQQECGEELADDGVLEDKDQHKESRWCSGWSRWCPRGSLPSSRAKAVLGKGWKVLQRGRVNIHYTLRLHSHSQQRKELQADAGGFPIPSAKLAAASWRPGSSPRGPPVNSKLSDPNPVHTSYKRYRIYFH